MGTEHRVVVKNVVVKNVNVGKVCGETPARGMLGSQGSRAMLL